MEEHIYKGKIQLAPLRFRLMLASPKFLKLTNLLPNHHEREEKRKKETIFFFTVIYISKKSGIKNFLK